MKPILLTFILFFIWNAESQIMLKNISLSEEYTGRNVIKTTVADLKGVLKISTLEDSRVFKLSFEPNTALSHYELQNFKASVENNYNIQLFKKNTSQYYIFKNDITYAIDLNQDEGDKSTWDIQFSITDESLEKIKNDRKEVVISTDF
jgi:hypothetical protein